MNPAALVARHRNGVPPLRLPQATLGARHPVSHGVTHFGARPDFRRGWRYLALGGAVTAPPRRRSRLASWAARLAAIAGSIG